MIILLFYSILSIYTSLRVDKMLVTFCMNLSQNEVYNCPT